MNVYTRLGGTRRELQLASLILGRGTNVPILQEAATSDKPRTYRSLILSGGGRGGLLKGLSCWFTYTT